MISEAQAEIFSREPKKNLRFSEEKLGSPKENVGFLKEQLQIS